MLRPSYALVLIAAAAMLVWIGCTSQAEPTLTESAPLPVRVADVTYRAHALPIQSSGRLASKAELSLSFKMGGVINTILVDEGTSVRAGQVLARLDLSEIEAQVRQARSGFEKVQRDLDRAEALYRDSVATLEQVQNARTALETAEATLNIAEFNRQYSEIRAPSNGRILRRLAEPSELIGPGAPVFRFAATARGWIVRVGIADRDVVRLAPGDQAHVMLDAFPGRTLTGRITEIAGAADPMSGTFEVEISLDETDAALKSGFIARVDLVPSAQDTLAFIPTEALVEGNGRTGLVYTVNPSERAERRTIEIAYLLDDSIAVRSGLEAGTSVVIGGGAYLSDNAHVQPQRP